MAYNFDKQIERKGTDALKYGVLQERYGRDDLLPLWVADMDFETPPEVVKALADRVQHGVFGYTFASDDYYNAIINWQKKRHNFDVLKEEICFVPGVVKGIAFAIDCFSQKDDAVIIQPPVYHPFKIVPTLHHRRIVNNPLVFDGQQYQINFEQLEDIAKNENCKMLILCNPHNPGGRVWTKNDLTHIAEICAKYNILVVSDEIHADLALNGHTHTPFASVSEVAAQNCITLLAPSKTFNIAGIVSSYSVIKNPEIRTKFHSYLNRSELEDGTIFAYLALQAAYNQGDAWLNELKDYLWTNILFVDDFLKKNIPQIKAVLPEASFLLWLDCRELQLSQNELVSLFVDKAKLALNDGAMFGDEGVGFMRMNIGCPRATLEKALRMLQEAVLASKQSANVHQQTLRKPEWIKSRFRSDLKFAATSNLLENSGLHTICRSGRCPNLSECWSKGTATLMILGEVCTRACKFCNTLTGKPLAPDKDEPQKVAAIVQQMKLKHAVITSVDRDDLPDKGATYWVSTICEIKKLNPNTTLEVLIPDFDGNTTLLQQIIDQRPDVISHNLETVRRLTPTIRSKARYETSLSVLRYIAQHHGKAKTGIMLGLGETEAEVLELMDDALAAGCKILTIGQYLQASRKNIAVSEYITPEKFEEYRKIGLQKGFQIVESAPFVRSSYCAEKHV